MRTTVKIKTMHTMNTTTIKPCKGKPFKTAKWDTDFIFEQRDFFTKIEEVLAKENAQTFCDTIKSIFYKQYAKQKTIEVVFVYRNCDIEEVVNQTYIEIVDNYDKYTEMTSEKPLKMVLGLAVFKTVQTLFKLYKDSMQVHTLLEEKTTEYNDGTLHTTKVYGYKPITSLESFNSETLLFGDYHNTPETEYIEEETRQGRIKLLNKVYKDIKELYPWYAEVVEQIASGKSLKQIAREKNVSYKTLHSQVSRARLTLKAIYNR